MKLAVLSTPRLDDSPGIDMKDHTVLPLFYLKRTVRVKVIERLAEARMFYNKVDLFADLEVGLS